ncbi:hypothetical protein Bbelb_391300 [Branchiostoma belcheri]|nr:hypothetical protein Bbelb_391300 [Branchiostoma belcheri]
MGGGSLFAYEDEKNDNITGGARNLARHIRVKTIDFSRWIRENIKTEDFVIFKLDVEGAEYDILQKMVDDGTFHLIDKFYGETHSWHPTGWSASKRQELLTRIKMIGFTQTYWAGEERTYADFDALHPSQVPLDAPGKRGQILSTCSPSLSGRLSVSVVVQLGMNFKSSVKLVATLKAHRANAPITLFVYGDFAGAHPDVLRGWATRFTIGIRESVVSSEMRLNEVGIPVLYYLPVTVQDRIKTVAENRKLRIIVPTVVFPPKGADRADCSSFARESIPDGYSSDHKCSLGPGGSTNGDTGILWRTLALEVADFAGVEDSDRSTVRTWLLQCGTCVETGEMVETVLCRDYCRKGMGSQSDQ